MALCVVLLSVLGQWAYAETNGFCQFETSETSSLPRAVCKIPACPTGADCVCPGGDCSAPQIESGNITMQEPVLLWSDKCVLRGKRRPCYEVSTPYYFRLNAFDSTTVTEIGFEVAIDTGDRRVFQKVWQPAKKYQANIYEANGTLTVLTEPNSRLEYSIVKLCAKDAEGNSGCRLAP